MKNILLIIQREYITRVKKKSFIIMTILGPLLMVLMYAAIIWAGLSSGGMKKIEVLDESGLFEDTFRSTSSFIYEFVEGDIEVLKGDVGNSEADALAYIPADILTNPKSVKIYSEKGVSLELQSVIENTVSRGIESIRLKEAGINQATLEGAKVSVSAQTISLSGGGEKKSSAVAASIIGAIAGFLIYMAVFIYGAQVMRSVTEEKVSRIVEILISSVKPFQLMIGKIVGVGLVGLTQFGLWIIFMVMLVTAGGSLAGNFIQDKSGTIIENQTAGLSEKEMEAMKEISQVNQAEVLGQIFEAIDTLPVATILISFIIYFLGGYLLYSSLFGAVGSAVDSETDTQQFMLPITFPILGAFIISQFVIKDPHSSMAVWTSMIPFTSPIIMMVRIPFGVPVWQIIVSVILLIGGFIFTTWVASRIYRIGILMYGKKVTWKELGKWLFYKG